LKTFEGKRVLVTGGTGSLGRVLVRRLLSGNHGVPAKIIVFSRDETKQHLMRLEYLHRKAATDEIIFDNFQQRLEFRVGDVRDFASVALALRNVDVVFNAAALKQVPNCEYFPFEALRTNVHGPYNIATAISQLRLPVETVVGVSTDKACKPVNVMGITKAMQERILIQANLDSPETRYVCARYGNVLASRGSVVPLFQEQIRNGGPVTITTPEMTRFLLSLEEAVDTILVAAEEARAGETYIPRPPAALITDVAKAMIGDRAIATKIIGIRPGEKVHESLISEEEATRTVSRGQWYAILPLLPELRGNATGDDSLQGEYTSLNEVMSFEQTRRLLERRGLMVENESSKAGELA
jgi:FlaA1/EpsC-like NDP-sugar epimerase